LYNLDRDTLVKVAKLWSLSFDETSITEQELRVLLLSHAQSEQKTEVDLPADVDAEKKGMLRCRSPSPQPPVTPKQLLPNVQIQQPTPPAKSGTTPDPIDRLCVVLQDVIAKQTTAPS